MRAELSLAALFWLVVGYVTLDAQSFWLVVTLFCIGALGGWAFAWWVYGGE